jgi:chromosomal replication initiation ATPase DnaA
MKERIIQYIETRGLDRAKRTREVNYKRIVLAYMLREEGYTFKAIGDMLSRNHASVVNMVKNYRVLNSYSDFRSIEKEVMLDLDIQTLEERVLEISSIEELDKLKEEIKEKLLIT